MAGGFAQYPLAWPSAGQPGFAMYPPQPGYWPGPAQQPVYGQAVTYMPMSPMQPAALPMPSWSQAYTSPVHAQAYGAQAYGPMQVMQSGYGAEADFRRPSTGGQPEPQLPEGALADFVQELGILPAEEDDFSWIAEYGLQPNALPPGWTAQVDGESSRLYYVDGATQESRWDNPLKPHLMRVVDAGRRYLDQPAPGFFDDAKQSVWERARQELDAWHGPVVDEATGQEYYTNSLTGESTWKDPREIGEIAQYALELESNLLSSLQQVLPSPEDFEAPTFGLRGRAMVRTNSGAEVMKISSTGDLGSTLSDGSATPKKKLSCSVQAMAMENAAHDRGRALRTAGRTRVWLLDACQAEEVVQRRELKKKVELRRLRNMPRLVTSRAGSKERLESRGAPAAAASAEACLQPPPAAADGAVEAGAEGAQPG